MGMTDLSIEIVEDISDVREGLRKLVDLTPGFRCSGTYAAMEPALEGIALSRPDVVLVDIGLPGMSGIEGIRILKERHPSIQLVVLTVYDDDERIFDAFCAGACGYLLKKTPLPRLVEGLREAAAGGVPMTGEVARKVVALFRDVRPPERADYHLTPHETRLLKMLVDGHNYKTAAAELKLSVNTVAFYMKSVYDKLQVHSKSEAVAKALRSRLIR
jgi:DNA-binding NarL/FixJ family response regulator